MKEIKYYEFSQNNTGGTWDKTLPKYLYIKAENEQAALKKAFKLGVYLDGVRLGIDCGCCGDRWSTPTEMKFPYTYTSFEKAEAEELAKKFGATVTKKKNHFGRYGLIFQTMNDYIKYQDDKWGKFYMGIKYSKVIN